MNKIHLLPQYKWFLSLHLQFIPYANFEGKNMFCFYSVLIIVPMYNDIHFYGARYYVQGAAPATEAPLYSSSAGMRQMLQAHGVMRDSASSPSCHNKLIPASLTSYSRQSSERGARPGERTRQKLPSNCAGSSYGDASADGGVAWR